VYSSLSRYAEALAAYSEAERLRAEQGLPPDPALAVNRAIAYEKLGELGEACEFIQQARELYAQQKLPEPPQVQRIMDRCCGKSGGQKPPPNSQ
jgi:tetratricopeptide (TPR) repeat protein